MGCIMNELSNKQILDKINEKGRVGAIITAIAFVIFIVCLFFGVSEVYLYGIGGFLLIPLGFCLGLARVRMLIEHGE